MHVGRSLALMVTDYCPHGTLQAAANAYIRRARSRWDMARSSAIWRGLAVLPGCA